MNFEKLFLISWKKLWIIVVSWFVAVMLHNLVYALFQSWFDARNGDEAFFFIIAIIVISLYFLIVLIYSCIRCISRKRK
ncbi:hypothetical protein HOD88_03375 [archaeon]|jgi:hypothetical protein|nr:hypothetical protein [archaeon]